MENGKNDKVKCEICEKEVSAKGLKTHIRMKHAEAPKAADIVPEITNVGPGKTEVTPEATQVVVETANIPEVQSIAPVIPVEVAEAPKSPVQANEFSHKHNLYKNRKG